MGSTIASATAAQGRRRRCPNCGHRQVASIFVNNQSVRCHRCGAMIPSSQATAPGKPAAAGKSAAAGKLSGSSK